MEKCLTVKSKLRICYYMTNNMIRSVKYKLIIEFNNCDILKIMLLELF
jgi:hypothetical protein